MRVYHGTSLKGIQGIIENKAIIPNKIMGSNAMDSPEGYDPKHFYGFSFFSDDVFSAIDYSSIAMSNAEAPKEGILHLNVVLEVELDENGFLPDLHDCPEATCWQDSMERIHAVRWKGEIPHTAIKRILLCHYDVCDVLVSCSFDEFEEVLEQYAYLFCEKNSKVVKNQYYGNENLFPIAYEKEKMMNI